MPKIRIREKDLTVSSKTVEDEYIVLLADETYSGETSSVLSELITSWNVANFDKKCSENNSLFIQRVVGLGGKVYLCNNISNAVKYVKDRNQFNVTFIYVDQETTGGAGSLSDNTSSTGPLAQGLEICASRRDCVVVYNKKVIGNDASSNYSQNETEVLDVGVGGDDFLAQETKSPRSKYCLPFYAKNLQEGTGDSKKDVSAGQAYILAFLNSVNNGNSPYKAVAGYKRGIIPISNLSVGLITEDEIDAMQPRDNKGRSINPIVNLTCLGENTIRILGDRTAYQLESGSDLIASSFASLRITLCAIKKRLYRVARKYQFETNDDILWVKYTTEVNSLLDNMKAAGVISSYEWFKLATTEKAKICAKLVITPVEPVEDFDLTIELQDSDAVVSE